jgi:hypothetical protein
VVHASDCPGDRAVTWVFNNTHGSLLLVAMLHAAANTAGVFLPITNTATAANPGTLLFQIGIDFILVVVLVIGLGAAHYPARNCGKSRARMFRCRPLASSQHRST